VQESQGLASSAPFHTTCLLECRFTVLPSFLPQPRLLPPLPQMGSPCALTAPCIRGDSVCGWGDSFSSAEGVTTPVTSNCFSLCADC